VHGSVTFDQPGKYEWIVPDGVTQVRIEGIGGGGSGGAALRYQQWGNPTRKLSVFGGNVTEYFRPVMTAAEIILEGQKNC
jgi:hypothetical protein